MIKEWEKNNIYIWERNVGLVWGCRWKMDIDRNGVLSTWHCLLTLYKQIPIFMKSLNIEYRTKCVCIYVYFSLIFLWVRYLDRYKEIISIQSTSNICYEHFHSFWLCYSMRMNIERWTLNVIYHYLFFSSMIFETKQFHLFHISYVFGLFFSSFLFFRVWTMRALCMRVFMIVKFWLDVIYAFDHQFKSVSVSSVIIFGLNSWNRKTKTKKNGKYLQVLRQ